MAAQPEEDGFLGRGWAFPPSFDKRTGSVTLVAGAEDVDQSLRILFDTRPGDRIVLPAYGCDVRSFLFRTMDLTTLTEFKDILRTAILNWEPRIDVNAIELDTQRSLDGILLVTLDYTLRATNSRSNRVYPLYLQEGTNL
ncbi:GPW/gp25 family protein [Stigmatella aurantiaca]|uniref:Phage baseplate assembly protein W n=1 Tax=Stigmatella aurantiaca (strain DW4/3-1) TaxID=378806 RepID=Q09DG9_STIAD|nr:GPW/gp25 family protein [Stigmatella aurantiaca]ADO69343.1 Phage baseplate assembly protein W (GPW/gp25 family) [Stigmatella aurantiaca DW4/3-1]EAU69722.1 phage baseplate assembly protein W [Stigmatella aurantiaca DW4/3-1]